jgi:hypothetical protein
MERRWIKLDQGGSNQIKVDQASGTGRGGGQAGFKNGARTALSACVGITFGFERTWLSALLLAPFL